MIGSLLRRADIPPSVIRTGAAIGVILLSIVLGWRVSPSGFGSLGVEVLIGGIVLAFLVVFALRHIEFGVLGIMLSVFLIRFSLPTGTQSRIPASMVLTGLMVGVWIVWMVMRHEIRLVPSRTNLPLIGFILVAIFSLPWSWLSWRPELWQWTTVSRFQVAQLGGLALMVLLPAAFLLALNVLRDAKWVSWLFVIMAAVALPDLVQLLTSRTFHFAGIGIAGPGLYHDWLIPLLYAQLLFNYRLPQWARAFFVVLILGWFYWAFVISIRWFSGWMPVMLALAFLTFLKSKKATVVLLLILVLPFVLAPGYYYQNVLVKAQRDDSNRIWLWQTIVFDLTLTKAGILLGSGPAGYATYFMTYYPGQAMSAHNNYVDIIAETGIVGTFFFLWFLFEVFRAGWNLRPKLKDDFLLAFNNGVLAGFVAMLGAMMLDDWFLPFAYNNGLDGFGMTVYAWILLGAMVGLEQHVTSQPVHLATTTQAMSTYQDK